VMMNPVTYNVTVQTNSPLDQKDEAIETNDHTNLHTDDVEEKMVGLCGCYNNGNRKDECICFISFIHMHPPLIFHF